MSTCECLWNLVQIGGDEAVGAVDAVQEEEACSDTNCWN